MKNYYYNKLNTLQHSDLLYKDSKKGSLEMNIKLHVEKNTHTHTIKKKSIN